MLLHFVLELLCSTRYSASLNLRFCRVAPLPCPRELGGGWGVRDGAVVRALAFHQCGPGSIPGPGVICGLSLLFVLVLAPRVFLPP